MSVKIVNPEDVFTFNGAMVDAAATTVNAVLMKSKSVFDPVTVDVDVRPTELMILVGRLRAAGWSVTLRWRNANLGEVNPRTLEIVMATGG